MVTIDKIVTKTKSKKAADAKETLEKFVSKIEEELESYFNKEIANAFGVSKKEKQLSLHILHHIKEHNLRPAKRLRGSFVYYGYKLLGGGKEKDIMFATMSIELIHTALLIHDDFMDQDDTRRGLPTTHEYYKKFHFNNKFRFDPLHYGESMAVNSGDAALCIGFEILGRANFNSQNKISALNRLFRGITNTALGQSFDITLEGEGTASEKDITDLHLAKTAIYTYENPLHMGAILSGANQKDLDLISKYAIPGGVAFQLQDDILGLYGDPKKTGKPAHSDLRQGKMTLLIIKALEFGNKTQQKRLKEIWGKRDLTESEANEVRKIVKDTGSLEYSRKVSVKWAKKAQKAVPEMERKKWNQEAVYYLDGIAQYMVEREV
ncbi:hypothetical protein A2715_02965 [Candidatus Woesebacteria bacterium RIFCSPHIGHO2_01_FULL_39_32]|uniref:Polyprenyl synthetase superfamily n=2 Tax=Candidatus Woeseibacteriota TaxID=1752722 RepID=A0A0G0PPC4_9BACT|nr:MAG: Polyprenyl synthetase superfamily [Candidatus Woesebacteria bacterium GW2011_GWA1_39_8]OGM05465.1 MAG: hypothetical protein A2124_04415 [Candidatus Woesebacteria bacterium GWB1_37_5]OGM24703.1 MAG: hypothetical protein A2715_02965 [Candidatus Woesebacteria bacterium RIFCSPHIGHO2_01_FULL_39_32]OGM38160.1 MAG: hypothetical protein A3F01_00740 [Candidatus Woesebacteria bacterium RIFCSPHIGHO2_12_FULL_38_11]OGM64529.1 MAG: hypothetical protein A2893_05880 [Candidatus Woesebacteria bacterium 